MKDGEQKSVLIVDDESHICELFKDILRYEGYQTLSATDGEHALTVLASEAVDLVVTDLTMPRLDGFGLIRKIRELELPVEVVVITGDPPRGATQQALRLDATNFLSKPISASELIFAVNKALDGHEEAEKNSPHQAPKKVSAGAKVKNSDDYNFDDFIGISPAIKKVKALMAQVADSDSNVMILGESGTGKEVIARGLHYASQRRNGLFVPINCGAIPSELLESELFGHEKGAFTGALSARKGRFELAEGGTLLLDEIGEMPPHMQVKLLRVLQERTYERVGSCSPLKADVRVIAATHQNLEEAMADNRFREDLFYRLNVFPIEVPPLRERTEDIPLLIDRMASVASVNGQPSTRFSAGAISALKKNQWKGNVRELENLVQRMAILYPDREVGVHELPHQYQHEDELGASPHRANTGFLPENGLDLKAHLNQIEYDLIKQALERNSFVVSHAAETLGMRRTTLVEKLRKYGLDRQSKLSA